MTPIVFLAAILLIPLVLVYPYLGLVFIIASLPITGLLPDVPFVSSVVPVLGALTVAAFLLKNRQRQAGEKARFTPIHLVGLLLIAWIFISNPEAAWFGRDRNWIITFVQLWVLLWLAGELLDSPEKHRVLFLVYSIAAVISAFMTIQQGYVDQDIAVDVRAFGLTEGANSAARYFVVAVVFLIYLLWTSTGKLQRFLFFVGLSCVFFGALVTASRTGLLMLVVALVLVFVLWSSFRYRSQVIAFFALAAGGVVFFLDNILILFQSIFPAIMSGSDTIGLRYALWAAGWKMWLAFPIQGVGVGMFRFELPYFAENITNPRHLSLVSHNMYVQMLSETGLVGFLLFMFLMLKTVQNLWQLISSDKNETSVYKVWLVVFVVILLGGITKTDQVDKMLWIVLGVGACLPRQVSSLTEGIQQKIAHSGQYLKAKYVEKRFSRK